MSAQWINFGTVTLICYPFIALGLFKGVPGWVKRFKENTSWM
jgi:hypothetical protein